MPGLLYYLPNKTAGIRPQDWAALGLDYAFTPGRLTTCEVRGGPDGGNGVVLGDSDCVPSHLCGYHADKQQWMHWQGTGDRGQGTGYWVGRYTDQPVTPADLARPKQLRGHLVALADDQQYLIPVARGWSEEDADLRWFCALPQRTTIDSGGKWVAGDVLPRLAALWETALRWHDSKQSGNLATGEHTGGNTAGNPVSLLVDFDGFNDAALLALTGNYRVSRAEVVLLGLFTVETAAAVLDALVDRPTLLLWLKKKSAMTGAGSSTAAGPAAAIAATAPPLPTSSPSPPAPPSPTA